MNKNKSTPLPPIPPNVKGVPNTMADNTPKPIPNPMPTTTRMWVNYTESNTLNTSGNASSLYDYNHIYPGFI
jgi:hypothetical protein